MSYSFAICAIQPAVCYLMNRQIFIRSPILDVQIKEIDPFGPNHLVWKTERYIWPKGGADHRLCVICHRDRLLVCDDILAEMKKNVDAFQWPRKNSVGGSSCPSSLWDGRRRYASYSLHINSRYILCGLDNSSIAQVWYRYGSSAQSRNMERHCKRCIDNRKK